jgi:hypothetical protein
LVFAKLIDKIIAELPPLKHLTCIIKHDIFNERTYHGHKKFGVDPHRVLILLAKVEFG